MAKAKRIFCVVAYDVGDDRRRGKIVGILEKYGKRVNLSVFECMFTPAQFNKVQKSVGTWIDRRQDCVVYYPLCVECFTRIVMQPERREETKSVYIV